MKRYSLSRVVSFDELKLAPTLSIDYSYPAGVPDGVSAYAQLGYSDEALLVHLWTEEPTTRAVEEGDLGMPCEDSCLEFFFCPMEGDGRYFNLEFNANGCMYLGFASGLDDLIRLVPDQKAVHPLIRREAWALNTYILRRRE